jgi:hypothetical protein
MDLGTHTMLARVARRLYRECRTTCRRLADRLSISPENWRI